MTTTPSHLSVRSPLPIDLGTLGRAAALELSQNAPAFLSLTALMTDMLKPGDPELVWHGRGPGLGTEVRRSMSGLFGRFFARWFAHQHLGATACIAIDGDQQDLPTITGPRLRAIRKAKRSGYLPDWAWVGAVGSKPVGGLLEAKATYYGGRIGTMMKGATNQLGRMQIERWDGKTWRRVRVKNWAVGSGWATDDFIKGGLARPLLRLDDPEEDGDELDDEQARSLVEGMVRLQLAQSLAGLGLPELAGELRPPDELRRSRGQSSASVRPGRWAATLPDDSIIELYGAVVLNPRSEREDDGVMIGYDSGFIERARDGGFSDATQVGVDLLPYVVPRRRVQSVGPALQ